MYYPYLRGYNSELLALRELAQKIALSGKITPIIEPINLSTETLNSLKEFQRVNMPFILIANPITGKNAPDISKVNEKIYDGLLRDYDCYNMGMIINKRTSFKQIEIFFENFSNVSLSLVHHENFSEPVKLAALIAKSPRITTQIFIEGGVTKQYMLQVDMRTQTIILRDCLSWRYIYSRYPEDELFSDMHLLYRQSGFDGFGDFTVLGDAVMNMKLKVSNLVVHFPYVEEKKNQIWVKHFTIDTDNKEKYDEAVLLKIIEMIVSFLSKNPSQIRTEGTREIIEIQKKGISVDYKKLKSIIVKHHLELINDIIN